LNLTPPVQQMLQAGDLDMGHARALLALEPAEQMMAANEISARKLSVREAERLVARHAEGARERPKRAAAKPGDVTRLEERLADHLATAVDIRLQRGRKRGGEVALAFGSLDELQGLLQRLGLADD